MRKSIYFVIAQKLKRLETLALKEAQRLAEESRKEKGKLERDLAAAKLVRMMFTLLFIHGIYTCLLYQHNDKKELTKMEKTLEKQVIIQKQELSKTLKKHASEAKQNDMTLKAKRDALDKALLKRFVCSSRIRNIPKLPLQPRHMRRPTKRGHHVIKLQSTSL